MKKNYYSIFLLSAGLFLNACSNPSGKEQEAVQETTAQDTVAQNTVVFSDKAEQEIYTNYIALKDALVKSDAAGAKTAADVLLNSLNTNKAYESAAASVKIIANATALKDQRKEFTNLNVDLISKFKVASLSEGKLFVQHCPMANNGDGGDWISSEKKIQNPYYGDEMMECGAVIEEIAAK